MDFSGKHNSGKVSKKSAHLQLEQKEFRLFTDLVIAMNRLEMFGRESSVRKNLTSRRTHKAREILAATNVNWSWCSFSYERNFNCSKRISEFLTRSFVNFVSSVGLIKVPRSRLENLLFHSKFHKSSHGTLWPRQRFPQLILSVSDLNLMNSFVFRLPKAFACRGQPYGVIRELIKYLCLLPKTPNRFLSRKRARVLPLRRSFWFTSLPQVKERKSINCSWIGNKEREKRKIFFSRFIADRGIHENSLTCKVGSVRFEKFFSFRTLCKAL